MAFLRKIGASEKYTFDVIYSAFQKLMRRNDVSRCLELAKEFKQYPNTELFEEALRNNFDNVKEWLNESEEVIRNANYLSKYNKIPMLKTIKKLKKIDNWKF